MMLNYKLSRRKFILIIFFAFISSTFILSDKNNVEINSELKNKIKKYNLKRTEILKTNIDSAINDDLTNNKTIWVGKKLFTYAEIF